MRANCVSPKEAEVGEKMLAFVNLRKTGAGWEFEDEATLEDFVWANLKQILGLTPLKRQYYVKGQVCDILALSENKQLVVLELKNAEDRYIVQQLTRYYDALSESKPFNEQVDYGQPIGLVAITPIFHKDNFTDRKYNYLSIQFLHFEILAAREKFYLQLKNIDSGQVTQVEINHQERDSTDNVPIPTRALLNLLSKGDGDAREVLLQLRHTILRFDKRMKEMSASGVISYGRGKSKLCAELRVMSYSKKPGLLLWLPNPKLMFNKKRIGRMGISTDWKSVLNIYYMPRGTSFTRETWGFEEYMRLIGEHKSNSLESLVNIALKKWLERL